MRATIVGASPPELHVQPFGEVGVLVSYTSERRLCAMLEGLVRGTAEHYGEALVVEEIQCMHRGDAGCVFTVARADSSSAGEEPASEAMQQTVVRPPGGPACKEPESDARSFRVFARRDARLAQRTGPVTHSVVERLPRGELASPAPAGRPRGT